MQCCPRCVQGSRHSVASNTVGLCSERSLGSMLAPFDSSPPRSRPLQVYLNFNCVWLDCGEIRVGDRVLFGPAVQVGRPASGHSPA